MIRIAVVDDEEITVNIISEKVYSFFDKLKQEIIVDKFINSKDMFEKCKIVMYDLLLLDIDMPEFSGFDLAKEIRKYNSYMTIIFITNKDELVYDSFSFKPLAFVPKLKIDEKLDDILEAFITGYRRKYMLLEFMIDSGKLSIKPIDIVFIFAIRHDLYLYTSKEEQYRILMRKYTLKKLESELVDNGFIRIHKSYLLNYKYIYRINNRDITLVNGKILPVSNNRLEEVKNKYQILLRSESI